MNIATPSPAIVITRAAAIIWLALSALVFFAMVKALVVAPNVARLEGQAVVSVESLAWAAYAALNAFVAFGLARLKRWAFIAFPAVLVPWLLYAVMFLLTADLALSLRRLVVVVAVLGVSCSLSALGAYPFLKADGLLRRGA